MIIPCFGAMRWFKYGFVIIMIGIVGVLAGFMIGLVWLSLLERKVMGTIQRRVSCNYWGWMGFLQPLLDALKLVLKRDFVSQHELRAAVWFAWLTHVALVPLIPYGDGDILVDMSLGWIWFLGVGGLGLWGLVWAGWVSGNRWGYMGAIRGIGQMLAFELSFTAIVWSIVLLHGDWSIVGCSGGFTWMLMAGVVGLVPWLILVAMESQRAPFDLAEAEQELVAGYVVEYGGLAFAVFFMAEYAGMWVSAVLFSWLWLGIGSGIGVCIFLFWMMWLRATYPRPRYDQVIRLGWWVLFPWSLGLFICAWAIMV